MESIFNHPPDTPTIEGENCYDGMIVGMRKDRTKALGRVNGKVIGRMVSHILLCEGNVSNHTTFRTLCGRKRKMQAATMKDDWTPIETPYPTCKECLVSVLKIIKAQKIAANLNKPIQETVPLSEPSPSILDKGAVISG